MTTAAAFGLNRNVFVDEWAHFVRVALSTNRIPTGHSSCLPESGSAMHVVAITALDETLVHPVVIRLGKIRFRRSVTPIAETRLASNEQVLRFLGIVRRVAVQAANVTARVRGCGEVPLFALAAMAGLATRGRILRRHILEADNFGDIAAALHVGGSGAVTGFAPVSVPGRRLEVWGMFELVLVNLFVARLAGVTSNVFL